MEKTENTDSQLNVSEEFKQLQAQFGATQKFAETSEFAFSMFEANLLGAHFKNLRQIISDIEGKLDIVVTEPQSAFSFTKGIENTQQAGPDMQELEDECDELRREVLMLKAQIRMKDQEIKKLSDENKLLKDLNANKAEPEPEPKPVTKKPKFSDRMLVRQATRDDFRMKKLPSELDVGPNSDQPSQPTTPVQPYSANNPRRPRIRRSSTFLDKLIHTNDPQNTDSMASQMIKYNDSDVVKRLAINLTLDDLLMKREEIGDDETLLAVKSSDSYLVGTIGKRIILVDEMEELYCSEDDDEVPKDLWDVIYLPEPYDYYMLYFKDGGLYKKQIDDEDPTPYLKVILNDFTINKSMKYSLDREAMICNQQRKCLMIVDIKCNKSYPEMISFKEETILDYVLIGGSDNKVLTVTDKGNISLHGFGILQNRSYLKSQFQIDVMNGLKFTNENLCVSICNRNRYLAVCISRVGDEHMHSSHLSMRILILELTSHDRVELRTIHDVHDDRLDRCATIQFYQYFRSSLIFAALTRGKGHLLTFDFDTRKKVVKEIRRLRQKHGEDSPAGVISEGNVIHYTGKGGKILKLIYKMTPKSDTCALI